MDNILSIISVMITVEDTQIGSGCLMWSNDHTKLYCITAAHCIKDQDYNNIQLKNDNGVSLNNIDILINNTDSDVAVLAINEPVCCLDIPEIQTYDCVNNDKNELVIVGFPKTSKGEQIEIPCKYIPHNDKVFTINMDSLDPHLSERFEEVNGFSGCGCFIKSGRSYKYIGMENKALNTQVSYKNLYCIKFSFINSLINSTGLPSLPISTPEYITDGRLHFELAKDYLSKQFPNKLCVTGIYNAISTKVNQFLNDTDNEDSTLFIGGLSGSGKTKSVLEAVKGKKYCIYYSCFQEFNNDIPEIKKYQENFYIIIDEATLEEFHTINSIFRGKGDKFKAIVIGCTPPNPDYGYDDKNTLFLQKLTREDTIAVIKENYPFFDEEVYQAIYDLSSNDLRLAIMITKIYDKDKSKDISTIPSKHIRDGYSSAKQILNKMLELSIEEKPQNINLENCFNHFSLFIDIGYKNEYASELKNLADFFSVDSSDYMQAIDYFDQIQLGIKKGDYFEESPRALAKFAFEQNAYSLVKNKLDTFMSSITSETLRKRFIERAIECGKKEVAEELSSWFQRTYSLKHLYDNMFNERELMLLTEYFPEVGLPIIKNYIFSPDINLNDFGTNFTYKIRRHIVWTCEHLANFSQYFSQCEEILFKLAQHETETYISNNSQGTWCGLYSILLSNTEVPYKKRFDILLKRALVAEQSDAQLFEKAFEIVFCNGTSVLVPPSIIGNKITPVSWKPKDYQELVEIKKYTLNTLIENREKLSPKIISSICNALFKTFHSFLELAMLKEYRHTTDALMINQDQKNELSVLLEENIRYLKHNNVQEDTISFMQKWIDELRATDTNGRLHAFLTRDIYSYGYTDEDREKKEKLVSALAQEFIKGTDIVNKIGEIIKSPQYKEEAISEFAEQLALNDKKLELLTIIEEPPGISRNNPFSRGYYCGIFKKNNNIPNKAITILDNVKTEDADFVLWASSAFDQTKDGFNRMMEIIPVTNNINCLINLRSKKWIDLLTADDKNKIILSIFNCDNISKYNIIYRLFDTWLNYESEESILYETFLFILKKCIDSKANFSDYIVEKILERIPDAYKKDSIYLFIQLFEFDDNFGKHNSAVLDYIQFLKKTEYISDVFYALADRLLVSKHQSLFKAQHGIFDDYPLPIIIKWLDQDRTNRPVLLAYHLSMPDLSNQAFSELTSYMLIEYADNDKVYRKFWLGNSNLVTFSPQTIYENKDKWYELTEKYANSDHARIKQWANDKRKEIDQICDQYLRSKETYKRLS